jgi:hypothetical protein
MTKNVLHGAKHTQAANMGIFTVHVVGDDDDLDDIAVDALAALSKVLRPVTNRAMKLTILRPLPQVPK